MTRSTSAWAAALAALAVLSGCASSGPKPAAAPQNARYAFTKPLFTAMQRNEDTLYLRLAYSDTAVRVTELSPTRITPAGKQEEVLFYNRRADVFGPAFTTDQGLGSPSRFSCLAIASYPANAYHPCASGSRFATTAVGNTIFVNAIMIPFTAGLGVGRSVDVNVEGLRKTVEELKLDEVVRDYDATVAHVRRLNTELTEIERAASTNIEITPNLRNLTGFTPPALTRRQAQLSLRFGERIPAPAGVAYSNAGTLQALRDDASARAERIKAAASFAVGCASRFSERGFTGTVACPERIVYRGPADRLPVNFTAETFSGGTRFPSLNQRDKTLALQLDGNGITLSNLSNAYVEVKTVTVYGGTEVMNTDIDLSLAPQSANKTPLSVANYAGPTIRRLFTFDNITAADVNGKSRVFGVAIKYRVGSGGNFETLLIRRDIPLASLF
ncbi:MAG TPA: hypothetical protein VFK82_03740 [Burkholderiaceae bacterium]|nr:hypothetical protein [Burkholderiaceae bacterium]